MANGKEDCPSCNGRSKSERTLGNGNTSASPWTPPTADELALTREVFVGRGLQLSYDMGQRRLLGRSNDMAHPWRREGHFRTAVEPLKSLRDATRGMSLRNHAHSDPDNFLIDLIQENSQTPFEHLQTESAQEQSRLTAKHLFRSTSIGDDTVAPSRVAAPWNEPVSVALAGSLENRWQEFTLTMLSGYLTLAQGGPRLPGFHINPGLLRWLVEYYFPPSEWESPNRTPDPADWHGEPPEDEDCDVFSKTYRAQLWVPLGATFVKTVVNEQVYVSDHDIEDNKPDISPTGEGTTAAIIESGLNQDLKGNGDSPDEGAEAEADEALEASSEWLESALRLPSNVLEGLKGRTPWSKLVNAIREALRRWPAVTLGWDPCSDDNCSAPEVCLGRIRLNYFRVLELRWQWNVQNVRRRRIGIDANGRSYVVVNYDLYVRWWARVESEFEFSCKCVDPRQDADADGGDDESGAESAGDPSLPGPIPVPGPGEDSDAEPGKPAPGTPPPT